MNEKNQTTRREFLTAAAAAGILSLSPRLGVAQRMLPTRAIPGTNEKLPVIGLGSSKAVDEIAAKGPEPLTQVLRTLVGQGGRVVDTWPRNAENDAAFGRVINQPDLKERLFVTMKLTQPGKQVGVDQFRAVQKLYGRKTFDLAQVFSLIDLETHWPTLKALKDEGATRYIGATVSEYRLHDQLEAFVQREKPDFVQVNYSITERRAEDHLLPLLRDRGIGVIINRPFMNGEYFKRLSGKPLPQWAAEFDCESWAQFSLKYILGNPAVTCVLTETTNPEHLKENLGAAFGRFPDEANRRRMREFIETV
ncbi:MAG: aldo/keto reductase [Candidatus Korobacteraceae bacterium]